MKVYKKNYTKLINGVGVTNESDSYYGKLEIFTGEHEEVSLNKDEVSSLHRLLALQTTHDLIKCKMQTLDESMVKEFEAFLLTVQKEWKL